MLAGLACAVLATAWPAHATAAPARDRAGGATSTTTTTATATDPLAPLSMYAPVAVRDTSVQLDWSSDPTGTRTGYRVYYAKSGGTETSSDFTTSAGTVSGLTPGSSYSFQAVALFSDGSQSSRSNTVTALTTGTAPASTPTPTPTPSPTPTATPSPTPTPSPTQATGGSLFRAPSSYAWYVAPNGSTSNTGRSASSPTTLAYARDHALPGETVGLLDGEYPVTTDAWGNGFYFRAAHSGSAGMPIRFRSVNPLGARFVWKGGTPGGSLLYVEPGSHDISIENLYLDGASAPGSGVMGAGNGIGVKAKSHHIRLIGNYIRYTSASGVLVQNSDYVLTYGNMIWECGNNPPSSTGSWGSGINYHQSFYNSDTAPGFHSLIVGNVVAGEVDTSQYHTDGNGIILDNVDQPSGFVTSPILIADNLVYMNGGRGIHDKQYSHAWIVNNSVYKSGLDTRVGAPSGAPQYMAQAAGDVNYVDNAAVSWGSAPNYALYSGATATFWRNTRYEGGKDLVPSTVSADASQLRAVDPAFTSPPSVAATGDQQWLKAPDPRSLGNAFLPKDGSPLIDGGIDPRSIPALANLLNPSTTLYLTRDRTGITRPLRNGWDIGATEAP